jgi:hypothetical protein
MIDDDGPMETVRRQGRRLAWLMAGAAIGLAVVLLVVVVVVLVTGPAVMRPSLLGPIVAPSLLLAALLGLVPGVRELEVTGARSMLGADGEMLVPRRPRAAHHLRTSVWVVLHLLSGLLCAVMLATFAPSAGLYLVELATGRAFRSGLPLPPDLLGRLGAAVLALLVGAVSLLAWWPLGAGLARLAPHLLGPTATDRLEAAEQRAAHEAERTRIARELHDGIGHALTVVSVQAAAARTVQHRDPEAAAAALAAIEAAHDAIGYTEVRYDDQIGKVSIVGAGMRSHPGVSALLFRSLGEAGINIDMISTSEIRISVVTEQSRLDDAVRVIHTAFGLDAEQTEAVVYGGTGR